MTTDWEKILEISNVKDLPWNDEKQLERLKEQVERLKTFQLPLALPHYSIVIEEAQKVQEHATKIVENWVSDKQFIEREEVREYLKSFMMAFQRLSMDFSVMAVIYCEFEDDDGNLCGEEMDIAVDGNGAYYKCRKYPDTHRRPK